MIKTFIVIAFRNIQRNPLFSFINIIGFTFGITASLLIFSWIKDELTADKFHANYEQIYRVARTDSANGSLVRKVLVSVPLAGALKQDYSYVEDATFFNKGFGINYCVGDDHYEFVDIGTAPNFFSFFSFECVSGELGAYDSIPNATVISQALAQKLYGDSCAIGKVIESGYPWVAKRNQYQVVAVVAVPSSSHIQFELAYKLEHLAKSARFYDIYFGSFNVKESYAYVKLDESNASKNTETLDCVNFFTYKLGEQTKLSLIPLGDIHFDLDTISYFDGVKGRKSTIVTFFILALIILLMAAFNFMVLTTVKSMQRNIEVGMRRASGSLKYQLVVQFISEAIVQIAIAMFLGFIIARLAIPWVNALTGKSLVVSFELSSILFILLMLVGVSVIAAAYPAFYLSNINITKALRGGVLGGRTRFVRFVVVSQFVTAIVLVAFTITINRQLNYALTYPLGFDRENVITFNAILWQDTKRFADELMVNPNVKFLATSTAAPNMMGDKMYENKYEDKVEGVDLSQFVIAYADADFAKVYGLKMIEGEFFKTDYDAFFRRDSFLLGEPIVINETAQRVLGIPNPIGHRLGDYIITGVVSNFNVETVSHAIRPLMFRFNPTMQNLVSIKLSGYDTKNTLDFIRDTYFKYRPSGAFDPVFVEDLVFKQYREERNELGIFIVFAFIAIVIAVMGVIGLAGFSAQLRTKEIGVRKVVGASTGSLIGFLVKSYVVMIIVSGVIALPISVILINRWLLEYAFRVSFVWWLFPFTVVLFLLVTLASVTLITYRAAKRNPVDSLRYE